MKDNYLLTTETARVLYEETARKLPVIDYHNHLNILDLAEDRRFNDIAELWLLSDPYKHRAMRICGVPERYITGDAGNFEKFKAWCGVYPKLMGGPLYDWSAMEMEKVFGIDTPIKESNAELLWQQANERLARQDFSARALLNRFNVEYAAPCAGILDELGYFDCLENLSPSMRGDELLCPERKFVEKMGEITGREISSFMEFKAAVEIRLEMFSKSGCCFADHALDNGFKYIQDDGRTEARFQTILTGGRLEAEERAAFASAMLRMLALEYSKRGWTMQLHIGAQRFTSSTLRRRVGAAGGFAAIGSCADVTSIVEMLDDMELMGGLPRTVLYTLNPADNAVMSVLSGSFAQDGVQAKVTQGPAWWWCDHLQGMREMLDVFSCFSVLHSFIGMTTDSRSLLSLLRHDYFRRTVCGWVGEKARRGELPDDIEALKKLIRAICYENAKNILKEGNRNA